MVGLKIMMTHNNFLSIALDLPEAIKLVNQMATKQLPERLGSHNVKCTPVVSQWCVASSEIIGMHTFSLEQAQGTMPMQGGFQPQFGRSGM